ncbi:MAG TPA: sugar phosphate isomerase/epimerase [Candidatus Acidoferrales bacterium]|nr:sugar phosphate isomerase/epimerase [Candidatus Acidoferrales bacterium]
MYTRREFGQTMLAAVPFSVLMRMPETVNGVRLGTITYSFNDMPMAAGQDQIDSVVDECKRSRVNLIELMCNHAEPVSEYQAKMAAERAARMAAMAAAAANGTPPPARGGAPAGGRRGPSPEAVQARDDLRKWRLSTPMSHFAEIKKKFDENGVTVFAYCVNGMGDDFTSEEIDVMFAQAKALGASTISSSTTLSVAEKLVPVVEKHQFTVAFHNHDQVNDPNQFSTGESILKGLAMSPWYRSNLDIGHYVESNLDPVEFIRQNHEKITHLHIADGQKNHGVEVPFGTGDTPLKAVVNLLKDNHYNIVGMVELEYRNPPGSNCAIEVRKCLDYLEQSMA